MKGVAIFKMLCHIEFSVMKKIAALILIVFSIALCPLCASMSVSYDARPTSVFFSWDETEGAIYYDIYNDNIFLARLSGVNEYEAKGLLSEREYSFSIAARDKDNNTLDAAFLDVVTDSWDGIYVWENSTKKDNKGKLKSLKVRIETKIDPEYGQYPEVWFIGEDGSENRIFPLFEFSDPEASKWHKYNEDSPAGRAYRENADRFNTTSFKPGKWKLSRIVIDSDETTAYILTSILSFELTTWSKFVFFEEDGIKRLSLETVGEEAIADRFIFSNPEKGGDGRFILTQID